jgi:hypothetical protein
LIADDTQNPTLIGLRTKSGNQKHDNDCDTNDRFSHGDSLTPRTAERSTDGKCRTRYSRGYLGVAVIRFVESSCAGRPRVTSDKHSRGTLNPEFSETNIRESVIVKKEFNNKF